MSYRNELAFGLDIGDVSIKALQLYPPRKGRSRLEAFGETALPEGLVIGGEIKEPHQVAAVIKSLLTKAHISATHVVSALPETKTFLTLFHLPADPNIPLVERVSAELQKHIPYPLSEIWWNYRVIPHDPTSDTVLAGAAPKVLVAAYTQLLERAGLLPVQLDCEALAIARSTIAQTSPGCTAIMDIGATKSTIIIATKDTVLATADGKSPGQTLTARLAENLKLEPKAAESMKQERGLKEGPPDYLKVVSDYAKTLTKRINQVITLTLQQTGFCPAISEIILTGGGAKLKGLAEFIGAETSIPTRLGDPWINTPRQTRPRLSAETALRFTTVCGLALTALNFEHASQ